MSISRRTASAAVGGLGLLLLTSTEGRAQFAASAQDRVATAQPVSRIAAVADGSIYGVVQDEHGAPVSGALVSAIGATKVFAITDKSGRFELRTLSAGSYLVRAHLTGFAAARGEMVDVRPSGRTQSSIALRHAVSDGTKAGARSSTSSPSSSTASAPILAAGVGLPGPADAPTTPDGPTGDVVPPAVPTASNGDDDHSEIAWRLRHLRRSVLQDVEGPGALIADDSSTGDQNVFGPMTGFGRSVGAPARVAANLFAGAALSGELNFLTTSSFDNPQQLFSGDAVARNAAYISVGAPAGSHADWAVRGALSQADISAWVIAGTYATRGPARHQYDVGLSYATQRYDGGNPAALRDVTDGSRNAGAVYGFDTFTVSPSLTIAYGARYARYDYLEDKSLVSPRVSLTLAAGEHLRVNTVASRRSIAPGAEEFAPPGDTGIWLPPQRTFSSIVLGRPLEAESTNHYSVEIERDLGAASAVSVRAFQQYIADQLVTVFGLEVPGQPPADLGHYFVGNIGDADARGVTAAFRTAVANRVHGSIEYSTTRTRWNPGEDLRYWLLRLPSVTMSRSDRIHDFSTAIVTDVPETSTHVLVLYRVGNALARRGARDQQPLDTRFDVQVRQSLPFMDFSTAKWEMLVGVRNFFRETAADQSVFDELLVVRPPKRIVGGLTMRF
jgi:hypothetical protein